MRKPFRSICNLKFSVLRNRAWLILARSILAYHIQYRQTCQPITKKIERYGSRYVYSHLVSLYSLSTSEDLLNFIFQLYSILLSTHLSSISTFQGSLPKNLLLGVHVKKQKSDNILLPDFVFNSQRAKVL